MNTQKLLSVKGLTKKFALPKAHPFARRKYLIANDDIYLDIYKGETFGLVGESGSGKSTLGRTLLQLEKPSSGEVWYYPSGGEDGVELVGLKNERMRLLRKNLQLIFQDPYSSLNPRMTVGQIIREGAALHHCRSRDELDGFVKDILQSCGLQPYAMQRYPHQFSGGQRQRVCIARALALEPEFIVCDECVSALDVSIQSQILNLLADLKAQKGLTYLFISHDLSVVRHICDRIAVMYRGKIVEIGNAAQIFENPVHPYTLSLLAAAPSLTKRKKALLAAQTSAPEKDFHTEQGCPYAPRCFMAKEVCQRTPVPLQSVEDEHFAACLFAERNDKSKKKRR